MELTKFTDLVANGETSSISAETLDNNFAIVKPLKIDGKQSEYKVIYSEAGWKLKIFPEIIEPITEPQVLVCGTSDNSKYQWISISELLLLAFGFSQKPSLQTVERCDGKTMQLIGTEWKD